MLNAKLTNLAANAQVDALTALLNGGTLEIYTEVQPIDADLPPTGELLAVLAFGTPAFAPGVNGVAVAHSLKGTTSLANGIASWYRCRGAAPVCDGSIGTSDANLVLNAVNFITGAIISVDSFVLTARK